MPNNLPRFDFFGRSKSSRQNKRSRLQRIRARGVRLETLEKRQMLAGDLNVPGETEAVGELRYGVAATDTRQGTGYIMFMEQDVYERFADTPPTYYGTALQFVTVVNQNGDWFFDDNQNLHLFEPLSTDVLVASVNFTNDTITDLVGTNAVVDGIASGYHSGDLTFQANLWNGYYNAGEFRVTGTEFTRNYAGIIGPYLDVGYTNWGIAATDSRLGTGYVMYSVEDLYPRFSPTGSLAFNTAAHLVAVVEQDGQWYYDNDSSLIPFDPVDSDFLVAELDFTSDTVTDLAGERDRMHGMALGYIASNLVFYPNYFAGGYDSGEFGVSGWWVTPWRDVLVSSQSITIEEDEQYIVQWEDFGVQKDRDDLQAAVVIDALPAMGSLTHDGREVLVGESISQATIARGGLVYQPGLDDTGVGSFSFAYTVVPIPNGTSSSGTLSIDVAAVSQAGRWDLKVRDESNSEITSAEVGEIIELEISGFAAGFLNLRGGWVDIAFNPDVLKPVGSTVYDSDYTSLRGHDFVAGDRLRSVGSSSQSATSSTVIATREFEVIAAGDPELAILPPEDSSLDIFLNNSFESYRPGQIDYQSPSFSIVAPPASMVGSGSSGGLQGPVQPSQSQYPQQESTTGGTPAYESQPIDFGSNSSSMSTGPLVPWEFVTYPSGTGPAIYDSTPLEATEQNRLFRNTPTNRSGVVVSEEEYTEGGTIDVVYVAIEPIRSTQSGESYAAPYLRIKGLNNQFFTFETQEGGSSGPTYLETGTETDEYFLGPFTSNFLSEAYFKAWKPTSPDFHDADNYEAYKNGDFTIEIVYQVENGDYSDGADEYATTPDNPAASAGLQSRDATIKDNEELITFTESTDAFESGPKENGVLEISLQETSPVIPGGLAGNAASYVWHSKNNYFEEDLRIWLEAPADANGNVLDNYLDPSSDFTLSKKLSGKSLPNGDNNANPSSAGSTTTSTFPLNITFVDLGIAGKKYWLVSDPFSSWIDVNGDPGTGVFDKLEIIIDPTADSTVEGAEEITALLEGNVDLPNDTSDITGEKYLTEYIHLDQTTFKVYDSPSDVTDDGVTENTPAGEGILEPDSACSCSCTTCGGTVPVRLSDGSAVLMPSSPDTDGGTAAAGPYYRSRGSLSYQQTARFAMPFENLTVPGSVTPDLIKVQYDVGQGFATSVGGPGISDLIQKQSYKLDVPPTQNALGQDDSLAVRLPVTFDSSTATGMYKMSARGIAEDGSGVQGVWNATAPVLINNTEHDYDFAPGWQFDFDYQLVVGTVEGGTTSALEDQGAALFRPDQSASYFPKTAGGGFADPSDSFQELFRNSDSEYVVRDADKSLRYFYRYQDGAHQDRFRLGEWIDAQGNRTGYAYNTAGQISSTTDSFGRTTNYAWSGSASQRILTITDWQDRTVRYQYSASSQTVTISHFGTNALSESPFQKEVYSYSNGQISSVMKSDDASQNTQLTSISYQSYGTSGTLDRVASISSANGETFEVFSIGFDDALPNVAGEWVRPSDWLSTVTTQGPLAFKTRVELADSYWSDLWNEGSGTQNDSGLTVALATSVQNIPRKDLSDFENYVSYATSADDANSNELPSRYFEATLDRKGRLLASEDPLGNVTHIERKVTPENGQDALTKDRGEVLSVTGPDPDRYFDGSEWQKGDLDRPTTTYSYAEDSPFISRTILPKLDSDDRYYYTESTGHVHGLAQRFVDELGNETFVSRNSSGIAQSTHRFVGGSPDPIHWQNSVDPFDVNNDIEKSVSALDALRIINELNLQAFSSSDGTLVTPRPNNATDYYDVSGDGRVSAVDALQVINELNGRGEAGRPAGEKIERTDYIYVGTQAYDDLVNDPGNSIGIIGTSISSSFRANDLVGAEIIQTGREDSGNGSFIRIYIYNLEDPSATDHGRLREVIETSLDPSNLNSAGDPRPDFSETAASRTKYTYDDNGFLESITDPVDGVTDFTNDELGRPVKVLLPPPGSVKIDGVMTPLARPERNIGYDAFGNVFQVETVADTFVSTSPSNESFFVPRIESHKRLTTYRYDSENRLVAIVEPAPNVDLDADLEQPEIINDPRNGLGSIAGLSSRPVTLYMYDEFGQIQEVSQLLQDGSTSASHVASTSFLYDKLGRAVQRLEPETAVTGTGVSSTLQRPTSYFNYYAGGNLRSTTDPSGLETAQVYDDWSRPTNVLIKQGATYLLRQDLTYESTAFASDAENGVAANRGWTVQSAYTKPGTAGQAGDLLRAEEQSFDQDGQVRETRSLLKDSGSQAGVLDEADLVAIYRHSYFADGQISSTIDPRGNEYSYEYDDLMRLSATIEPWIAAASDTGGPSTTLTGRPVTTYEYDLAGQLTSRTDSTERETTYTYDKLGNIDTISNGKAGASVYTIDYDYNGFSEVSRTVTNPSEYVEPSSGTGANDNSTFTATFSYYDRLGRQTIDQNGFFEQTQYDYDRGSRLVGLTDAADNLTQWAYDQTGKMQSELATIDDPSSGPLATQVVTRLYGYDSVGNLVQEIDREGRVTRYSYDALHQPSTERWYDNTSQFASGNSSGGFNFAYDPIGQLLSVGDQAAVGANYSHEYDYAYDVGGRLTTELQDLQGLSARVSTGWSREYDLSGNAIGVTALTNASLTDGVVSGTVDHHDAMTRDSHNRVSLLNRFVGPDATSTSASDLNSQAVSFTYDREGRLRFMDRDAVRSSTTYGLNTEISYDNAGRVNEVDHSSERVSVPFSAVYSTSWLSSGLVNLTNSLLDSTIADSALQAGSGLQRSFTYDTRGQLQEESINSIANGVTLYEYDTNGNRIGYQQNTTPSAAESIDGDVGADNRLDKDGEAEYKYDKEGNLIRKTYLDATEQDTDDVNWRYTWDHRNRLTQAQRYVGESSLQQTITYAYDAFNRLVRRTDGGVVETFAYDGEEVGLHYINSQLENRYLWQEGVDQLLAEQDTDTGTIAWTLLDRQGNVRDRVRATGNHIQHFDYDAFGREQFVASSSSVTGNADLIFGYTGKMSDEDTGLQHNQNRWYDDSTGRWLSQDPIGFAAGDANLYRYVGNQPTTKTDPSGLADIIDGDPTHGGVIMMLPTGRIIVSGSIMRSHHGPGESTSFLHGYDAIPNPTELAMINILRENGNYCDYQILDRNPTFANTFAYNHLYSPEAGSRTLGTLGYSLFSPPRIAPYAGPVVRPPLKPFYQWRGPRILSAEGQKGLRSPRVVAEIKGDMQAGRYRFKSDEGRIGGYYNEGCYYIGEGHHRMNAAMQIFEETGNSYFVEQLLQHGRWTPRTPPRPGPLPRK